MHLHNYAKSLKNQGFYSFSKNNFFFEADTLSYPDSAVLKLRINEYTRNETARDAAPIRRFYINDVRISYPKSMKIREKVLTDLNLIRPGEVYGDDVAETVTIQYGGSMNAKNADELVAKVNVDGGLIGGASLKPADFTVIVKNG